MLKSFNFGNLSGYPVDLADGFRLESPEDDAILIYQDQPIAIVASYCDPDESIIEVMTDEYEIYGCKYCGTLLDNTASIVIAPKGTSHYEPCQDCREYITDGVAQTGFKKPDDCETVEDCVEYILGEITSAKRAINAFDFNDYFERDF